MPDLNSKILANGSMAFYDNYIPSLEGGIYNITVNSGIKSKKGDFSTGSYFDKPVKQQFEIRAPQFALPAQAVHSVFPPENSSSIYERDLPCIVLEKRVTPWERYLDANDSTIPWMALLVFNEDEITVDKQTNSSLITAKVREFLHPESDVIKPDILLSVIPPDVLNSTCQSIIISADIFYALVPRLEELKYLTHVRQIDAKNQVVGSGEDIGWFSVVLGNRLLKGNEGGCKYFVHLVSLEGFKDYLVENAAFPKKESNKSQNKDLQLISLYNWSFISQPQIGAGFSELVENFVSQTKGNADNLLLRRYAEKPLHPDEAMKKVLLRLQNGYVPLEYQTPAGEKTFAWYRGPFSPVVAQPIPKTEEQSYYSSPDSAMIYDSENGVFDQSYAAAWSIGRALALADASFSQALMKHRRNTFRIVADVIDNVPIEKINKDSLISRETFKSAATDKMSALISEGLGDVIWSLFSNIIPNAAPIERIHEEKKNTVVENMKAYFENESIQRFITSETDEWPETVVNWVASKMLLYGVPFNNFAADAAMLPVEALRFFYIDKNWINMMIDGALSIGVHSSKDVRLNKIIKPKIYSRAQIKALSIRSELLGILEDTDIKTPVMPASGIIIRSLLIKGWPGLEIKAFKNSLEIKIVRMDRLSSNVLLCLFLDIPDMISISEPQQGLKFGLEDRNVVYLRSLTEPVGKTIPGKIFPKTGDFNQFLRVTNKRMGDNVININSGTKSVVQTLQLEQFLNKKISPAEFGIQMAKVPQSINFKGVLHEKEN